MSDKTREALLALIEAVQYTPLGIRAIKAVEQGRAALAEPAAPVAKPVMPTEAELIAIAERLGSVAELCRTEDHPDTIWRIRYEVEELVREVLKTYAVAPVAHTDDAAVDRFAAEMKAKLASAREKGRCGWDDPAQCSVESLAALLVAHLGKGNAGTFEDVANFAMMLHQRGADPRVLAEAAAQVAREPVDNDSFAAALAEKVIAYIGGAGRLDRDWRPGLAGMIARRTSRLTAPPTAEQPTGTKSDKYRAELYDEVWAKARGLGYGNATEALAELERLKSVEASPEPVKLAFPTMLRKMWSGGDVQDWLDRQGPLYRTPPAAAPQACPGCRALSAEMTALRAGRDYCGACPDGCDRCSVRENSPGDLEGDGTARAGAMGEAYLVLAEQDYESPIILRAFHSEPAAQAFAQQLRDYQGTQPEWPSIDDSEDVFARKEAAMNAWRSAHPGGEDISSRRDFAVLPVPVEQNNGVPVPVKPAGGEM